MRTITTSVLTPAKYSASPSQSIKTVLRRRQKNWRYYYSGCINATVVKCPYARV